MNRLQRTSIVLRAIALSCAFVPHHVSATPHGIPLTPLEQTATLIRATSQAVAFTVYSGERDATITRLLQRDYRSRYLAASLGERISLATSIGEEGVERFSRERRWRVLLPPKGRSIRIGPDSTYWDSKKGTLRVLEAKGGTSPVNRTYNSLQGTNKNAIRSAEGFLRRSGTTWKEQIHMARLIKAAQQGHLETGVVKTAHVLGRPREPRQAGSWDTRSVAREAKKLERELIRQRPQLQRVFRVASFLHNVARVKYRGTSRLSDLASSSARYIGLTPPRQTALWRVGQMGARWIFPVAVGLSGLTMVTAYYHYSSGVISAREFYRTSAGPAIAVVFTSAGAVAGSFFFGVGAVPGAAFGAMASLPVELVTDWGLERYFRVFDQRQRRLVDAAVDEHYKVDALLIQKL